MKTIIASFTLLLCFQTAEAAAPKAKAPSAEDRQRAADEALVDAAKDRLARRLTDPDSVKFRDVFISPRRGAVCGDINAKNRMGGYVGYRRFIVAPDKSGIEEDESYFVEANWEARCKIDAVDRAN